jgi:hypothetical protein
MWNSAPNGSGTVLTWPPAADDRLVANGKVVFLNVNVTVASIHTDTTGGATTGGQFHYNMAGVTLTANITGHTAPGIVIRVILASGTVNFVGTLEGGAGTGIYITSGANATVNITGNLGTKNALYIDGTSATQVNIVGDIANVTNTCVDLRSTGATSVTVTGNAIAGSGLALTNAQSGTVTVSGYAQASGTHAAINNVAQGILQVGETRSASNGRGAVTGAFRFASATAAKTMPYTPDGQISMTVLDVAAIVPAESDVRKGLVYGDGAYTGTLPLGRSRISMAGRF